MQGASQGDADKSSKRKLGSGKLIKLPAQIIEDNGITWSKLKARWSLAPEDYKARFPLPTVWSANAIIFPLRPGLTWNSFEPVALLLADHFPGIVGKRFEEIADNGAAIPSNDRSRLLVSRLAGEGLHPPVVNHPSGPVPDKLIETETEQDNDLISKEQVATTSKRQAELRQEVEQVEAATLRLNDGADHIEVTSAAKVSGSGTARRYCQRRARLFRPSAKNSAAWVAVIVTLSGICIFTSLQLNGPPFETSQNQPSSPQILAEKETKKDALEQQRVRVPATVPSIEQPPLGPLITGEKFDYSAYVEPAGKVIIKPHFEVKDSKDISILVGAKPVAFRLLETGMIEADLPTGVHQLRLGIQIDDRRGRDVYSSKGAVEVVSGS